MVDLPYGHVRELFVYDPLLGVLHWRMRPRGGRKDRVAGCLRKSTGHLQVRVGGRSYLVHRIIWVYMTGSLPVALIDHEDTLPANNCWENLREATVQQNAHNTPARVGHKCIFYEPKCVLNPWRVRLQTRRGTIYNNWFPDLNSAIIARDVAILKHHGKFTRGISHG